MTDQTHFQDLLDRYGSMLAAWPERERTWAHALLAKSAAARDLLAQAEAFDRDLQNAVPDARTEIIRRAVLDALPAHQLAAVTGGHLRTLWWRWVGGASAAAASLVLSFYIGTTSGGIWSDADGPEDGAGYAEFDNMLFGIGFEGDQT